MATTRKTVIQFGNDEWEYRPDEVDARFAARARRVLGTPPGQVYQQFWLEPTTEMDTLAALIWLARSQGGEDNLTLDEVVAEIGTLGNFIERNGFVRTGAPDPEPSTVVDELLGPDPEAVDPQS